MHRTLVTRPGLLRRLLGRRTPGRAAPDPAEMGTAMALDYLLDEPPPAASPPCGLLGWLVAPQISTTHKGR